MTRMLAMPVTVWVPANPAAEDQASQRGNPVTMQMPTAPRTTR